MKRREEGIIDIMQVKVRCNACFIPDSYYSIFFSSRRRHTRFSRDWSSDVCSSDLWTSSGATLALRAASSTVSCRLSRAWASGDSSVSTIASRVRAYSISTLRFRVARPCSCHSSADVDVAWRGEVVADDETRVERSGALVRDSRPDTPGQEHRMEADAAVGRRDRVAVLGSPRLDHPVD